MRAIWAFVQLCLVVALPNIPTLAQITPDTTLGAEGSRLTPGANVQGLPAELIEGGAQRDTNLFHSFSEFNVNNGQRVYFANPTDIENIFTRVTGNNISNILGTLGVNGDANLFLLNPNGIIFGSNATLDINGSFLATTANSFQFPGGTQFSATNPQAPSLLSINVPLGVQYGSQPGTITNAGNLTVGQDLTLAGGNLDVQGQLSAGRDLTLQAQDTVRVRDSAATPFIASAGGKLVVQGNLGVDIFVLNHANSGFYSGGDMVLRSANTVGGDAHYWSGGSFRIETLDGSLGNLFSPYDPIIFSSGDVSLGDYTGASLHILAGGSVTLGNVEITGADTDENTIHPDNTTPLNSTQTIASLASFTLSDGTPITIQGNTTPTLDVRAGVDWAALGGFPAPDPTVIGTIPNPPLTPASSANITVNGTITNAQPDGLVLLTNQFQPNTTAGNIVVSNINTFSNNSGPIIIDSRGNFTPTGNLDASTLGDRPGGNIIIRAVGDVSLNGTSLSSNTFGQGDAGNISIKVQNIVSLADGKIFSNVESTGEGNGGLIEIQAGSLSLTDGAQIQTLVRGLNSSGEAGQGNAGNILVDVRGAVSLTGMKGNFPSAIFSNLGEGAVGEAGDITIKSTSLSLSNGAAIISSTSGQGDAGNISIQAQNIVSLANSKIFSDVESAGEGNGGLIEIQAGSLSLTDEAEISSSTNGEGNAGNVLIQAQNIVSLANSNIFSDVESAGEGNGGLIEIQAGSFSLRDDAQVTSSTEGQGNAGNVFIKAQDAVSLANSNIFSNVESTGVGNSGLIEIQAGSLSLTDGAQIQTLVRERNSSGQAGQGNAGNIVVDVRGAVTLTGVKDDSPSAIFSELGQGAVGKGGNIEIQAGSLSLRDGAEISSSTEGQGDAGNVFIKAQDAVSLANSSIFSDVESTGVGNGGNIDITAPTITITDGASLQVDNNAINTSANGTVFRGGTITTNSNALFLDNEASITAETATGNGGDIKITVNDKLLMRHNSLISTTAGSPQNPGNGGTITINANNGFVIAVPSENSDIIANAFGGQGGKINIQAIRVFGLKPQSRLTSSQLQGLRSNRTSDISASSDVGLEGDIKIETLNLDPAQGLVELPVTLVDPTGLIAQGCESGNSGVAKGQSTFVVTGRGGLPPSPDDPLSTGATPPPWVTRDSGRASKAAAVATLPSRTPTPPLVEAQGMVIGSQGEIILTAGVAAATPHPSGFSAQGCSGEG